jgi:hypothetical protein
MDRGNIKMDLEEIGWEDIDWVSLVQDRNHWLVPVMRLRAA